MTQAILSARLDAIAALLAALATADTLRRVELLAAVQQHVALALRWSVVDARQEHTLREVAGVLAIPHSVLHRQLHGGGPIVARTGRVYYTPASRNALTHDALPRAS